MFNFTDKEMQIKQYVRVMSIILAKVFFEDEGVVKLEVIYDW